MGQRLDVFTAAFNRRWEPIVSAVQNGRIDVNLGNENGRTILFYAVEQDNFGAAEQLIRSGARVRVQDSDRNTVLHCASARSHHDILKLLIGNGANCDSQNEAGRSCVHVAACHSPLALRLLLEKGAHANTLDNDEKTPLHCFASLSSPELSRADCSEICRLLLKYQCDFGAVDVLGKTAMQLAREREGQEVDDVRRAIEKYLKMFLKKKAREDDKKKRRETQGALEKEFESMLRDRQRARKLACGMDVLDSSTSTSGPVSASASVSTNVDHDEDGVHEPDVDEEVEEEEEEDDELEEEEEEEEEEEDVEEEEEEEKGKDEVAEPKVGEAILSSIETEDIEEEEVE